MTSSWKVAVVGLGAMGYHHVRITQQLPCFDLIGVFDVDTAACRRVQEQFKVPVFSSLSDVFAQADVVYIATPTKTHFEIAVQAIQSGCHLFLEKPIVATVQEAQELLHLSQQHNVLLGVGHTERFNPVIAWLHQRLQEETILSINIERVGPRPPRIKDVGIVTDLAVHDLDLIAYISRSPLQHVRCVGNSTNGEHEDIAQIVVSTANRVVGSINTNWLTPFKSRKIHIATSSRFFEGDLLRSLVNVYEGDKNEMSRYTVEEPSIRWKEPLLAQGEAFCQYLAGNTASGTVDGKSGMEVLQWVSRCLRDLKGIRE